LIYGQASNILLIMENEIESLITDFTCNDVTKYQITRHKLVGMGSAVVEPLADQGDKSVKVIIE
jgi:hypothetical protein